MVDKSLSGHCHFTKTCARDLKVLNASILAQGLTCADKDAFWGTYAADDQMTAVDAFVTSYALPASLAYLPFDRPVLLIVTIRYEVTVADPDAWRAWTAALQALGRRRHSRFVIAANNMYDVKYVQYFTGLTDDQVVYMPSHCHVSASYAPQTNAGLLIMPRRVAPPRLVPDIKAAFDREGNGLSAHWMAELYPHYTMDELAQHRAIIFVPYTVSVMTFFEVYRMNIPTFVPSKKLLIEWHLQHGLLTEMTWPLPSGAGSPVPPFPAHAHWPDPNNDTSVASLTFWLDFADLYTFEHLIEFDDLDDLVAKARSMDETDSWHAVSSAMAETNRASLDASVRQWRDVLLPRLFGGGCHQRARAEMEGQGYAAAASAAYPGVPHGC